MNPLETCFMNSMEKRGTVEWSLLILSRFSFSEPKLQKSMQAVKCCSYIYRLLSGAECNNRLVHLELFHKNCITTNMCFVWDMFCEKVPNERTGCYIWHQRVQFTGRIYNVKVFSKGYLRQRQLYYSGPGSLEKDQIFLINWARSSSFNNFKMDWDKLSSFFHCKFWVFVAIWSWFEIGLGMTAFWKKVCPK